MACECQPKTGLILWIINCCIGIVVGLFVAIVLGGILRNWSGIPWGLASVVLSALTMILIIYLYNRKYVKGVSPHGLVLCLFGTVGGIATAVGIGGIGAYLGLGIINSMNGSEPAFKHGHYVVILWCFDTFSRGFTLYYFALKAFKELSTVTYKSISEKNP